MNLSSRLRAGRRVRLLAPQFTVTVALGIGSVAAVASLALALGYQKLPFRAPGQLVAVWERGNPGASVEPISGPDMEDIGTGTRGAFVALAPFAPEQLMLSDWTGSVPVSTCAMAAAGFETLGIAPVLGRGIRSGDAPAGLAAGAPAWISEHLWRTRYGANPAILGRVIRVGVGPGASGATPFRVVGVLPAQAAIPLPFGTTDFDIWYVLRDMSRRSRAAPGLFGLGRLRPGVDARQAQAALQVVTDRLGGRYAFDRHKLPVVEGLEEIAAGPARRTMGLLVLGVGLVFLVACVNLAVLMLAEGLGRRREVAIRSALGASRRRLWAEAAAEKCGLTAVALAIGLGLAWILLRALTGLVPSAGIGAPLPHPPPLQWAVVAVFAASAFVAALIWSYLAVAAADVGAPARWLAGGGAPGAGAGASGWRLPLLASQSGVGICLLAAAALAAGTYVRLSVADLGPAPRHTVLIDVAPQTNSALSDSQTAGFKRELISRLARLPGSQQLAIADELPPDGDPAVFVKEGDLSGNARTATMPLAVSSGFFRALGIPILYGRGLASGDDRPGARRVAVINLEMASENWPAPKQAVGSLIAPGAAFKNPYLVVGVAGDFTGFWFQQPVPMIYVPEADSWHNGATVILRTGTPAGAVAALARQALVGTAIPATISQVRTVEAAWEATLTRPMARMVGMLLLALLGLGLSLQGVYAAATATVAARRHELAVRAVMGAAPRHLAWTVTRALVLAVLGGGAAGAVGALALEPLLAHWLGPAAVWRFEPIVVAIALLALSTAAGCYFPARAATRANPAGILRQG
ncbi:MAG: ABC transporter permease [Terriglobales bacterium]